LVDRSHGGESTPITNKSARARNGGEPSTPITKPVSDHIDTKGSGDHADAVKEGGESTSITNKRVRRRRRRRRQ
jgi:hypothetical protein